MKRHLLAASALALAACTSAPPTSDTLANPTQAASPQTASAMAAVAGGKNVYETFCAACHSGGDETAPELKTLHTFNRDRVSTALSDAGLMALQSKMINADQREQVIAFITAPAVTLAALEAANNSADPGGLKRDAYRPEYSYPVRRVRDERDSPESERPPAWAAPPL
ncbi:MAG: cytochrome c, partial [Hyphomonadaceae bacterium]|nr:cytochrome c [Hyphomonadaceae bacterium]